MNTRVAQHLKLSNDLAPRTFGRVKAVNGTCIVATLPGCSIGNLCKIERRNHKPLFARVVGFSENDVHLAPFDSTLHTAPESSVELVAEDILIDVGPKLLGTTINALGQTLDGNELGIGEKRSIFNPPPSPFMRRPISSTFRSSVCSIDGLLTLGAGQRVAILAPAGVGKSTLLGEMIRAAEVDVAIVALVGERGREINEFITEHLSGPARQRTVLIASTSDEPSMLRQIAPYTATTIAEYFRDQGKNVLLVVDSLTRTARAIRETGLAAGELPVRHGYPNSLYSELPRLLERPGVTDKGTITALYTVLTNAETDSDPLADEVKSLLDGHITLSPQIAAEGIYPAIDFARSVSRVSGKLQHKNHFDNARRVLSAINRIRKDRELILMGGTPDPELAHYMRHSKVINSFITKINPSNISDSTLSELSNLAQLLDL